LTPRWIVAGASVRGARHVNLGEPNEDSVRVGLDHGRAIALVADGHGSAKCGRADIGSALAVKVGFEVLAEEPRLELDRLPQEITTRWQAAVAMHLAEHPPTADEAEGAPHPHYLLYGTTLLGVMIDGPLLRLVQIGDGDVLLGRSGQEHARRPIPPLEVNRPGETDSLCQHDAADRMSVIEYDLTDGQVDVVLLASDGLDTAFADPTWHDETMADVLRRVQGLDAGELEAEIAGWCGPPAEVGGDDTTIALIVCRH